MTYRTTEIGCVGSGGRDLALDYLAGRLPPAEAAAYEEHYLRCPACSRELERALELRVAFAESAREEEAPGAARPARHGWRWGAALAAAAALVLAFGLGRYWRPGEETPARVLRGGEGTLSLAVAAGAEGAGLTLAWEPFPDADLYVVRLFSADGEVLFEERTADPAMAVGPDALAEAVPGTAVFAKVEALDRLRRSLAASPLEPVPGAPPVGAEGRGE